MWSESSENRSVKIKSLIRFKLANLLVKIVFSCYFLCPAQLLFLDLKEAWFQLCFFMRVPNLLRCVKTAMLQLRLDFWEVGEVVAKKVWWVVQVLREDWRQCFLSVFPETGCDSSLTVRTKSQFTTGWMLGGEKKHPHLTWRADFRLWKCGLHLRFGSFWNKSRCLLSLRSMLKSELVQCTVSGKNLKTAAVEGAFPTHRIT